MFAEKYGATVPQHGEAAELMAGVGLRDRPEVSWQLIPSKKRCQHFR